MYDFESLVRELLQSRPELGKDELMRRIEDKKRTIGAGYLTDQGALFLVAGELGVSLRKDEISSDMTIKDLYIGSNDVTVVARVLAVYPEATFEKKSGGTGQYMRIVLFDGPLQTKLTAWDEKVDEIKKMGPKVDSVVRVVGGYVKQGLDGKPTLNLGRRGSFELVSGETVSGKLQPISEVADTSLEISQEKAFVGIKATVASEPRYSEFTRSDGSPGSLFQFGIVERQGKRELRVVIWNPSARPELKKGQRIIVTNVRSRRFSGGEFEIHGDTGSEILQGSKDEVELRVAAIYANATTTDVLGLDRNGKVSVLEVGGRPKDVKEGSVIKATYESESGGKLLCLRADSIQVEAGASFPGLEELSKKLKDAKADDSRVMVEVIALSHGSVDNANLRDGSTVRRGELVVGDDTDEIKLVAWRDLADKVNGIQPGERLRVVGASVRLTTSGGRVLEVSNLTAIEKIRNPG